MQYAIALSWLALMVAFYVKYRNNHNLPLFGKTHYGRHAMQPVTAPSLSLQEKLGLSAKGDKDPDKLLERSLRLCAVAECGELVHIFNDVCRHCGGVQPEESAVDTLRISVADARMPVRQRQEV